MHKWGFEVEFLTTEIASVKAGTCKYGESVHVRFGQMEYDCDYVHAKFEIENDSKLFLCQSGKVLENARIV